MKHAAFPTPGIGWSFGLFLLLLGMPPTLWAQSFLRLAGLSRQSICTIRDRWSLPVRARFICFRCLSRRPQPRIISEGLFSSHGSV